MTNREKIELLKDTICFLYEKEGRSKSYISRLLDLDRTLLTKIINTEWKLEKANKHYIKPSTEKFLNKNKEFIISKLRQNVTIKDIAKLLNVDTKVLYNLFDKDKQLNHEHKEYIKRMNKRHENRIEELKNNSGRVYDFEEIEGEEWKEILGYPNYFVSTEGRVKKYIKAYDSFILLSQCLSGQYADRYYVRIENKNLQVARLVGFAFIDGHSEEKNTIDHKDNNPQNNKSSNLQWVSQSENNQLAYDRGRKKAIAYEKHGKFKKIILNGTYEFKTIRALAKFCGVSETQMHRYIDGETESNFKIEFIY